jgi:hypothetical protein
MAMEAPIDSWVVAVGMHIANFYYLFFIFK